jgi:hypothetical protein
LRATTGFLLALTVAAAVGLSLTWWTLAGASSFGSVAIGPWTAWPKGGAQDADRYARARVARSGDLPLGSGEGLALYAWSDSGGRRLDGRCRYTLAPIVPPTRWWTLTLYDEADGLVSNEAGRHGFASTEVVREPDGRATIVIAPEAQPGNWLPSPQAPFSLSLRLYDTPISAGLATADTVEMPAITRESCP